MKVVIPKSTLEENNACKAYLDSPEWSEQEQALVYADWQVTVDRLLSSYVGSTYLNWLIAHKLVPMTAELTVALANKGQFRFGDGVETEKESVFDKAKKKFRSLRREAR